MSVRCVTFTQPRRPRSFFYTHLPKSVKSKSGAGPGPLSSEKRAAFQWNYQSCVFRDLGVLALNARTKATNFRTQGDLLFASRPLLWTYKTFTYDIYYLDKYSTCLRIGAVHLGFLAVAEWGMGGWGAR